MKRAKLPKMEEVEKMAEVGPVAAFHALEYLLDTSVARRRHLYNLLSSPDGALALIVREI